MSLALHLPAMNRSPVDTPNTSPICGENPPQVLGVY